MKIRLNIKVKFRAFGITFGTAKTALAVKVTQLPSKAAVAVVDWEEPPASAYWFAERGVEVAFWIES